MYKLRPGGNHLRNILHKIISELIPEAQAFKHMLIQINRPLSPPGILTVL